MSYTPNAKDRILECATKVFTEKSFDGARINDIANMADVPNSLIYYHFKSKDEILEVLIQNFLNNYVQLINSAKNNNYDDKKTEIINKLDRDYFDFVRKNEEVVRILFFESLKSKGIAKPPIFKLVEELVNQDENNRPDYSERLIAEFFTNIIPVIAYQCFEKQWCDYFSIPRSDLNTQFRNVLAETHGAYHNNRNSDNEDRNK